MMPDDFQRGSPGANDPPKGAAGGILGTLKGAKTREFMTRHLLPSAFFLLLSLFIYRNLLGANGQIINADLARPPELGRFFQYYFPMWNEYGSTSVISRLPQLLFYLPFFTIGFLFNMDTTEMLVMIFIFTKALAGVAMYYASSHFLKGSYEPRKKRIMIASICAGLAYMWSAYAVYHTFHPFILTAYSLAPLAFLSLAVGMEKKRLRYIVLTGFLWCIMCGDVHWMVYGPILFFGYILYHFARDLARSSSEGKGGHFKRSVITHLSHSLLLVLSYVVFSAYWLIPGYFMGGSSRYAETLSIESLDRFYQESTLPNVVTKHSAHYMVSELFIPSWKVLDTPMMESFLVLLGVGLFLFCLLAPILNSRNSYVRFFAIFGSISLFLAVCVRLTPPIGHWLILKAPFNSYYGWAFKTPKISQFVIFSMCFLLAFSVYEVLNRIRRCHYGTIRLKKGVSVFIISVLLLSILLPNWPLATGDINGSINPVKMPDEFSQVNHWLNDQEGDFKVLWIPDYRSEEVYWNEGHRTTKDVAGLSSAKPTYIFGSGQSEPVGYGIYFMSSLFSDSHPYSMFAANVTDNLGKILAPLGIKYVIYHDDNAGLGRYEDEIFENLKYQKDLELVEKFGFIYIYRNICMDGVKTPHIYVTSNDHLVSGGLSSLSTLSSIPGLESRKDGVIFADQRRYDSGELDGLIDDVVHTRTAGPEEIAFTFMDERYLIAPFLHTDHVESSKTWSKFRLDNIKPNVQRRGKMEGWDWAYDKEIVCTWSNGEITDDDPISGGVMIKQYDFESNVSDFKAKTSGINLSLSGNSKNGTGSLMGMLERGNITINQIAHTDKVPLPNSGGNHRISLYVGAKNAMNVQVIMNYYDVNRKWVARDFIMTDSGNFDLKRVEGDVVIRSNVFYYSVGILANQNPFAEATWWIDDVKIFDLNPVTKPNRMKMEFTVDSMDTYEVHMRNLKSEKGGRIKLFLDGDSMGSVDTIDDINSFTWEKIDSIQLKRGKHTLSMENADGFNAVNLFAVVPEGKMDDYLKETEAFLEGRELTYALEAERSLLHENATVTDSYGSGASSGKVLELGGSENSRLPVEILKQGNYSFSMRMYGENVSNNINVIVGNESYALEDIDISAENGFSWIGTSGVLLNKGSLELEIAWFDESESNISGMGKQIIDLVVLHSTGDGGAPFSHFGQPPAATILDYKKIDATRYEVKVSSSEPFLLCFSEAYDEHWVARVKGSGSVDSIPVHGMVNGFFIKETGNLTIVIEYRPQQWFEVGAGITIGGIVLSIGFLILADRREWGGRFRRLRGVLGRSARSDRSKGN